jgi:hypothetical protein
MGNYLIDTSIYTMPKQIPDNPDVETVKLFEEYLEHLNKLFEFIGLIDKNLKVNQFLFCRKGIELLLENNLFLDETNKKKLWSMEVDKKHKRRLDSLEKYFLGEIVRLRHVGKQDNPEKLCTVEAYIGIGDIEINDNNSYVPDFTNKIPNINFSENLKKNICKLAFLNDKIYKGNDITQVITNKHEKECNVNIFIKKINHNFNNIDCQNIEISDCTILNNNIMSLEKYNFISINDVLAKVGDVFHDTIMYNNKIYESISEYENKLKKLRAEKYIDLEKIDNYRNEYPFVVFNCLDVLDKLVKFHRLNSKINDLKPLSKNFKCRSIGENEICNKCRGYLRICGLDCVDEYDYQLTNLEEIRKRTIDGKLYQNHLRLYTVMRTGVYEYLTLRIYFRWDTDKIEIGYLGNHL